MNQNKRAKGTGELIFTDDAGGFRLDAGTDTTRNVFLSRKWLVAQIGKDKMANALLVDASSGAGDDSTESLQSALAELSTLADYGLKLVHNPRHGYLSLETPGLLLGETQLTAAREAASECGARFALTSIYLADTIEVLDGGSSSAYAVVAAVEPLEPFDFVDGGSDALLRPNSF